MTVLPKYMLAECNACLLKVSIIYIYIYIFIICSIRRQRIMWNETVWKFIGEAVCSNSVNGSIIYWYVNHFKVLSG